MKSSINLTFKKENEETNNTINESKKFLIDLVLKCASGLYPYTVDLLKASLSIDSICQMENPLLLQGLENNERIEQKISRMVNFSREQLKLIVLYQNNLLESGLHELNQKMKILFKEAQEGYVEYYKERKCNQDYIVCEGKLTFLTAEIKEAMLSKYKEEITEELKKSQLPFFENDNQVESTRSKLAKKFDKLKNKHEIAMSKKEKCSAAYLNAVKLLKKQRQQKTQFYYDSPTDASPLFGEGLKMRSQLAKALNETDLLISDFISPISGDTILHIVMRNLAKLEASTETEGYIQQHIFPLCELARFILRYGADVHRPNNFGMTVIDEIVANGNVRAAAILFIEQPKSIECAIERVDKNGNSLLHHAIMKNYPFALKLLHLGSDLFKENNKKITPWLLVSKKEGLVSNAQWHQELLKDMMQAALMGKINDHNVYKPFDKQPSSLFQKNVQEQLIIQINLLLKQQEYSWIRQWWSGLNPSRLERREKALDVILIKLTEAKVTQNDLILKDTIDKELDEIRKRASMPTLKAFQPLENLSMRAAAEEEFAYGVQERMRYRAEQSLRKVDPKAFFSEEMMPSDQSVLEDEIVLEDENEQMKFDSETESVDVFYEIDDADLIPLKEEKEEKTASFLSKLSQLVISQADQSQASDSFQDNSNDSVVGLSKSMFRADMQLGWNCFDIAVGIEDRAVFVNYVLEHAENEEFRKWLAPEIRHAAALTAIYINSKVEETQKEKEKIERIVELFNIAEAVKGLAEEKMINDQIIAVLKSEGDYERSLSLHALPSAMHTEELRYLLNGYFEAHEKMREPVATCNEALRQQEKKYSSLEELDLFFKNEENQHQYHDAYNKFARARRLQFQPYEDELNQYCQDIDTYKQYVSEYYAKQGWFAFQCEFKGDMPSTSMIDIAARYLNKQIIILHNNSDQHEEVYRTKAYDEVIIIEYQKNNHFMRVTTNELNESEKECLATTPYYSSVLLNKFGILSAPTNNEEADLEVIKQTSLGDFSQEDQVQRSVVEDSNQKQLKTGLNASLQPN